MVETITLNESTTTTVKINTLETTKQPQIATTEKSLSFKIALNYLLILMVGILNF